MTPERWQKIKSLLERAIELPAGSRHKFLMDNCDEPEMVDEVELFLTYDDADGSDLEGSALAIVTEKVPTKSKIGEKIGSYEIVAELGAGGMGSVFLATRADGEFAHKVAIKLIKSGLGSDSILRRFYAERQILASLDHPNIAHLIDGGTTDDGMPYLVMEYVEGETIVEFARNRKLDVEGRLDLFRAVCSGVAFAHQNLVIHRDLKPSNILVNKDGIPKLLDFGIAKLIKETNDGETLTHQLAFTPEYASPEQIRGENLTTSTDVYSLGVVLYELLTGVRPFVFDGKNLGQIVQTASNTQPLRPSKVEIQWGKREREHPVEEIPEPSVSRLLRGDIDNIVLKSLNKDPARRFSSVEKLAEDIRRHLKGLPVSARQDSWHYRAGKFARRNPLVVGAVALAFMILLAGISATTYQARRANAERERAEKRFNDVRNLANSFIFEINAKIAESPIEARELLVQRGLEYLDSLSNEAEGDETLQRELAAAYQKIGNLQSELFNPSLGKTSEALLSQRKALEIRERLLERDPTNTARMFDSIQSRVDVANILSMNGRVAEARDEYQRAVHLGEYALALAPNDAKLRNSLARSYAMLGQSVLRTGSLSEALENYERSRTIYRQLEDEKPNSQLSSLSLISSYIGYVKLEMGSTTEAIEYFETALAQTQKTVDLDPGKPGAKQAVIIPHLWLGVALSYRDPDRGIGHIQRSLDLQQEMVDADKKNLGELSALADCYLELGRALVKKAEAAGKAGSVLNKAVAAFQTAIEDYETVRQADPDNVSVLRQVSFTRIHLAGVFAKGGEKDKALAAYEQALAESEQVNLRDEMNTEFRHDKAICLSRLAEFGVNPRANLALSIEILEKLVAESPEHVERRSELDRARVILSRIS